MKYFIALIFSFFTITSFAQLNGQAFLDYQLTFPRVNQAYNMHYSRIKSEVESKGFKFPVNNIYIRSFKSNNEMEIWIKDPGVDTYRFFKKYDVCALSGDLGPKRQEGDLQVPEGYYFITDFNPNSSYHLSMLVSYPNYSDRIKGNRERPGGDIFVHGGCVTVGCLPMKDEFIREIYVLCLIARSNGQLNIPIHIFPTRFNTENLSFLAQRYNSNEDTHRFWVNLKSGFDYFEKNKKILPVMYNQEGKYIF